MNMTTKDDRPAVLTRADALKRLLKEANGAEIYGPYTERKGTRLYWRGAIIQETPLPPLRWIHLGPAGEAYDQGPVNVTIPRDLEEELADGYWWSKGYYFARVYKPLGRLLRLMGTRYHVDEEVP